MALHPTGEFSYEYRQSIYGVGVSEHFRHEWGRLRLERVRSSSVAALEYFRWPTQIRREDESFVVEAPHTVEDELVLRVAAGSANQLIRTRPGYFYDLRSFGPDVEVVRVRGAWRPLLLWLPIYRYQGD